MSNTIFKKNIIKFVSTLDEHEGTYEGEYKIDKLNNNAKIMHGKGKFTFDDGYIYEGLFLENERVGRGKLYAPLEEDWIEYEGYFNEDFTCDIEGKLIYRNGNIYEGMLDDGVQNGFGKMTFSSGNIYTGNFVNNKMDGIGLMIYNNYMRSPIIKSITANWIDENNFDIKCDIKIEFDHNLLDKFIDLREEIESASVFPNLVHKYIPVLGKETKRAELKYVVLQKLLWSLSQAPAEPS